VNSILRVDVAPILAPFASRLPTRHIVLETQLLPRSADTLCQALPAGPWLFVVDETTWNVAGQAVDASVRAAGVATLRYTVEPAPGESVPVADDAKVDALETRLRRGDVTAVVAVGSGTVNDIAKLATFRAGVPYAVVGTSPSMNGYTSAIAAILSQGVKVTLPCHAPIACLADLDIMAASPYRMIASGFGDLLSKPVSNADWRLGARIVGSDYSPETMKLVEPGFKLLEGVAPRLAERDTEAVGKLTGSLCVSGLAMAVAGSSSPASGGEHLISHYLDMTHFAHGDPHDFHGCQVGVGTITTAALYECLASLDPATVDIEARVAALASAEEYEVLTRQRFGPLADAVVPHMKSLYPTPEALRQRLGTLLGSWDDILADVSASLRPAAEIRDELLAARCPTTFAEIGATPERARRSVVLSKDIRGRYTILHLAWELGMLEDWADHVLRTFHGI
jgi:glycerol-1-phosphate dehydrogenase [NAD(P)+]